MLILLALACAPEPFEPAPGQDPTAYDACVTFYNLLCACDSSYCETAWGAECGSLRGRNNPDELVYYNCLATKVSEDCDLTNPEECE
jgi:hypothetical protein